MHFHPIFLHRRFVVRKAADEGGASLGFVSPESVSETHTAQDEDSKCLQAGNLAARLGDLHQPFGSILPHFEALEGPKWLRFVHEGTV